MARCAFEHALDARCRALKAFDEAVISIREKDKQRKTRYEQVTFASLFLKDYVGLNGSQNCPDTQSEQEYALNTSGVYEEDVGVMEYFDDVRNQLDADCGLT